jgi:hypothetical protein
MRNVLLTNAAVVAGILLWGAGSASYASYDPRFFFAEEPLNARNTAMGCVGAAQGGGGFCLYNPASIALTEDPFIGVEFGRQGGGLSKSLIQTAWMFPSWFVGVAMPVQSNDWQIGTEQGVGAMSSDQMFGPAIVGGYSRGQFATGHAIMVLNERIGEYAMHAVTYSTGVTYRIIPGSLMAGASAYNYLRMDPLRSSTVRVPRGWYEAARGLPRMVRAGVAWTDTVYDITYTAATDVVYRDLDERFMVPIGIEAWILPWIAARMGKRFNHPTDLLHVGCGIRWSTLAFDFDYSFDRPPVSGADLEPKWLVGLTYSLKRPKLARQSRSTGPATDKKQSPSALPPSTPAPLRPAQQDSISKTIQAPHQVPDGSSADTVPEPGVSSSPQGSEMQPQPLKMPLDSLAPPSSPAQPADSTMRR